MEKALEVLKEIEEFYNLVLARELATRKPVRKKVDEDLQSIYNRLDEIREAIAELEEAMKPKTCEGCNNLEDIGKSYKYCKELCINISHSTEMTFYCIRYEPKDNA